jgi:hypothetical protein
MYVFSRKSKVDVEKENQAKKKLKEGYYRRAKMSKITICSSLL